MLKTYKEKIVQVPRSASNSGEVAFGQWPAIFYLALPMRITYSLGAHLRPSFRIAMVPSSFAQLLLSSKAVACSVMFARREASYTVQYPTTQLGNETFLSVQFISRRKSL